MICEPRTENNEPKTAMPFDPTYPPTNALIESAPMRSQFNGLKDLIDAMPGVTSAQVVSVTTLPPGSQATAVVSLVGTELHFSFAMPEGATGAQGEQGSPGSAGSNGNDGAPGQQGPQGVPGEVTLSDLNSAVLNTLSQTSNNSNAVDELPNAFSDPDVEALRLRFNQLINALRR
jgi:hypothetical protein